MMWLKTYVMIVGMSIGVNMFKADPRLWVPVSTNYKGFAFKPSQGWLSGSVKQSAKHSRNNDKGLSAVPSMSSTTNKVRA